MVFGPFKLYTSARVLTCNETPFPLAPRTFDLLVFLAESKGRLVSKQELLDAVWGDTFVEETSLSFQISTLRKALGEQGFSWIETVPKHGYRFNVPVEPLVEAAAPVIFTRTPEESIAQLPASASPNTKGKQWRWKFAGGFLFFIAIVIAAALIASRRKQVAQAVMEVRPVTTYSGRETQPSISPDGRQVAFAWDAGQHGNFHIYVKLIAGGSSVPLTSGNQSEFSPSWSPDGRWIAFCRDTGRGGEIVIVPSQGGAEKVMNQWSSTWEPTTESDLQALSWFPSSDALAAVGYALSHRQKEEESPESGGGVGGRTGLAVSRHPPNAIYLVPINGSAVHPITTPARGTWGDALPAISADGRSLAFTRTPNEYWVSAQLYFVPLSAAMRPAGEPKLLVGKLSPPEWQIQGVAWSLDGRDVLFANRGLWSVPLSGGPPVWLPVNSYRPGRFSLSRDGSRLVFATSFWDLDIWRMPGPASEGTPEEKAAQRVPFLSSTELDTNPQYSPDGRRIAFTSRRSGRLQIWVCDSDGSNPLQLTDFSVSAGSPRWSPDSRFLAFDSIEAGKGDIYVIPAEGGPARRMTPDGSHEDVPSWSADGHWIYYESDRTGEFRLWKTEFPSGRSVQVTSGSGVSASESPDGKFVYYAKRGQIGLWRMLVKGGAEERVSEVGHPYFWGMSKENACFLDVFKEQVTTTCLNLSTKRPMMVSSFPNDGRIRPTGPSFSVSPDGRWILYSRIEREEADLMLVDKFGLRKSYWWPWPAR
jgi:Tol biopolymer transport system component/DNA-binding winged helix-turn-helix (wHTH) protein